MVCNCITLGLIGNEFISEGLLTAFFIIRANSLKKFATHFILFTLQVLRRVDDSSTNIRSPLRILGVLNSTPYQATLSPLICGYNV